MRHSNTSRNSAKVKPNNTVKTNTMSHESSRSQRSFAKRKKKFVEDDLHICFACHEVVHAYPFAKLVLITTKVRGTAPETTQLL